MQPVNLQTTAKRVKHGHTAGLWRDSLQENLLKQRGSEVTQSFSTAA